MFDVVVEWVVEAEIPHSVFYAFSTENWRRSESEVSYLLRLLADTLITFKEKAIKE